ncbi:hypothetical protein ACLOJK_008625 [Asimina triloba]
MYNRKRVNLICKQRKEIKKGGGRGGIEGLNLQYSGVIRDSGHAKSTIPKQYSPNTMLLHLHYCRLIKLQSPSRDSSTTVEKMTNLSLFLGFFFLLFPILSLCSPHLNHRQVYIVYLGEHTEEKTEQAIEDGHYSFLLSVKNSEEEARASLLYSYKRSINGFAALLTEDEAAKLSDNDEVVSAFPSRGNGFLATTRSWDFVSLEEGLFSWQENIGSKHRANKRSQDVIVGVLDSAGHHSKVYGRSRTASTTKRWGPYQRSGKESAKKATLSIPHTATDSAFQIVFMHGGSLHFYEISS